MQKPVPTRFLVLTLSGNDQTALRNQSSKRTPRVRTAFMSFKSPPRRPSGRVTAPLRVAVRVMALPKKNDALLFLYFCRGPSTVLDDQARPGTAISYASRRKFAISDAHMHSPRPKTTNLSVRVRLATRQGDVVTPRVPSVHGSALVTIRFVGPWNGEY